jgi:hypothetical protein
MLIDSPPGYCGQCAGDTSRRDSGFRIQDSGFRIQGCSRVTAEVPRRYRLRVLPQSFAARACLLFERRIASALERRLVALVLLVMPREAGPDLLEAGVDRVRAVAALAVRREYTPDDAAVAVALVPDDPSALLEDDRGEVLLRALAVRLAALGRIDPRQADPVLLAGCVEKSDRVTVGDCDDGAEKLGGVCGRRDEREQ